MITVKTDDRIRLLSSILALTVGNDDLKDWAHPHPLRIATQRYLEQFRSHACVSMVEEICRNFPKNMPHGGFFYQIALLLKEPPDIEWDIDSSGNRDPKKGLKKTFTPYLKDELHRGIISSFLEIADGFPLLLSDFYRVTRLGDFWLEHAVWWEEATQQCEEILSSVSMSGWLSDFYGETRERFFLVPNPTDPSSDCYYSGVRKDMVYAIIGPPSVSIDREAADSEHRYALRPEYVIITTFHEFSHGFLNPILNANPSYVEKTENLQKRNDLRGWFPAVYTNWKTQFEEILIRALTALFLAKVEGEAKAEQFIAREKEQHGIHAIDELYTRLLDFHDGRKDGKYSNILDYLKSLSAS